MASFINLTTLFPLILCAIHVACLPYEGSEQIVFASPNAIRTSSYKQNGVDVELVQDLSFSNTQLRLTEPKLCNPAVKQRAGFLDISQTRHLFFWFFEARNNPKDAPVMLWLNGGPGGSTIASGMLFDTGPCEIISTNISSPVYNKYSWNENLNIIYLDEPIGTGFSHSDDGSQVTNLKDLAKDVYAFLQVFLNRFPQYATSPLHIVGESWGGHYVPNIGNYIYERNKKLQLAPQPGHIPVNLESLVVANGLTEPASQFESIPEYACEKAKYSPLDPAGAACKALKFIAPACVKAINACYRNPTKATCVAATGVCWVPMMTWGSSGGKNPYDLSSPCREGDTGLCYPEFDNITTWMNLNSTKIALGVEPTREFRVVNSNVNQAFYREGQAMLNSAALLPELVDNGIRLLAFAGDTDAVCNYVGVERWMTRLEHTFHEEFQLAPSLPWNISGTHSEVGQFRAAGSGAGNVTFVRVYNGGHMAPHDQPQATLDMITRWINNVPYSK